MKVAPSNSLNGTWVGGLDVKLLTYFSAYTEVYIKFNVGIKPLFKIPYKTNGHKDYETFAYFYRW